MARWGCRKFRVPSASVGFVRSGGMAGTVAARADRPELADRDPPSSGGTKRYPSHWWTREPAEPAVCFHHFRLSTARCASIGSSRCSIAIMTSATSSAPPISRRGTGASNGRRIRRLSSRMPARSSTTDSAGRADGFRPAAVSPGVRRRPAHRRCSRPRRPSPRLSQTRSARGDVTAWIWPRIRRVEWPVQSALPPRPAARAGRCSWSIVHAGRSTARSIAIQGIRLPTHPRNDRVPITMQDHDDLLRAPGKP